MSSFIFRELLVYNACLPINTSQLHEIYIIKDYRGKLTYGLNEPLLMEGRKSTWRKISDKVSLACMLRKLATRVSQLFSNQVKFFSRIRYNCRRTWNHVRNLTRIMHEYRSVHFGKREWGKWRRVRNFWWIFHEKTFTRLKHV